MSFSSLLKTHRESAGLTQGQAAEQLGVTEKTISNWETGSALPTADKCKAIGEAYGIDRETLFKEYNDTVWPQDEVPEAFPSFLFCEDELEYIEELRFTPQEVELIRMLEIYCTGEWDFSSLSKAYERIRRLPYEYIERIGVAEIPQMMMGLCDKFQMDARDFYPDSPDYDDQGKYQGGYQKDEMKNIIVKRIMLPEDGEPISSFDIFKQPLQVIVQIAKKGDIYVKDYGRYYRFNERNGMEVMQLIDEGHDMICYVRTDMDEDNDDNCKVDSAWAKVFGIKKGYRKKNGFCWKEVKGKIDYIFGSSWVDEEEVQDGENQVAHKAFLTDLGKELWDFYKNHQSLFDDDVEEEKEEK